MNQWQTSARTRKQFGLVMDDTADKHDIAKRQILKYYCCQPEEEMNQNKRTFIVLKFCKADIVIH